jgi:molybdopterin-binding protein
MRTGARNSLKETIKSIAPGAVNTKIIIELSNGVEVAPDYHERFGGTLRFGDGQNGLRRRQSERRA